MSARVSAALRVGALVLAAGASSRLGRPKQLVELRGEPLVRRAARAAVAAGAAPVVVVLGAHAALIAPALAGLDAVTVHVHPGWAAGLASSLVAGLDALEALEAPARCDAVLVTLADQPLVDGDALRPLIDAARAGAPLVAAAYGDALGVPAVFARAHLAALRTELAGDVGAGAWLRRRRAEVTALPLGAAALDVDTAGDLARLARATSP